MIYKYTGTGAKSRRHGEIESFAVTLCTKDCGGLLAISGNNITNR